jgi:hypothetical protein
VDWKILILGITPPILAILAEIFNPVSEHVIKEQVSGFRGPAWTITPRPDVDEPPPVPDKDTSAEILREITNLVSRGVIRALLCAAMARRTMYTQKVARAEEAYQENVNNIAERIAEVSSGAVEVSGVIPTWISVTAAVSTILADLVGVLQTAVILLAWTLVSGLAGLKFFTTVNYYEMVAYLGKWSPRIGGFTGKQVLSGLLILANIVVIVFVSVVASHSSEPVSNLKTERNFLAEDGVPFPDAELNTRIQALSRTQGVPTGEPHAGTLSTKYNFATEKSNLVFP